MKEKRYVQQGDSIAFIDMGSNSIRLMIGTYRNGEWHNEPKQLWTTRLGDRQKNGLLKEASKEASFAALEEIKQISTAYGVREMVALGTGALRQAPDGPDFIAQVEERLGISCSIISGEEEATIAFVGAAEDFIAGEQLACVIDLGGATTEVCLGTREAITEMISYPVGAVVLKEASQEGVQRVWEETRSFWNPMKKRSQLEAIIAIGGTATTAAAIDLSLETYDPAKVHGHPLTRETLEGLAQQLRHMTPTELDAVPGLPKKRQDIIVSGLEILCSLMDYYDMGSILVSEKDGLEGFEEVYYGGQE